MKLFHKHEVKISTIHEITNLDWEDQIDKILQEKLKSINYELFSRTSSKNKSQRASKKLEQFPNDDKNIHISPTKNITEELEKLASLKEKGLLTDEEFSAAKAKLLDK